MPLLLWEVGAAFQRNLCQYGAVLSVLPAFNAVHGPLVMCFRQLYIYVSHAQTLVISPLSFSFTLSFLISSVSTWKTTFLCGLSCPALCRPAHWVKLCVTD